MQDDLSTLVCAQAMLLFREQGLRFTMQQVAQQLHISKKTIYTVYPSKEKLLMDMVDRAFKKIHRCKQEILEGGGTLQEKLRAVIIAMPEEYAALDLQQMKERPSRPGCVFSWRPAGNRPWLCWSRPCEKASSGPYPCGCCGR